jgi:hypothetical protein
MKKAVLSILALVALSATAYAGFSGGPTPGSIDDDRANTIADSLDAIVPKEVTRFVACPYDTFGTFDLFGGYEFAAGPWDMAASAAESLGTANDVGGRHAMIVSNAATIAETLAVVGEILNDSLGTASAADTAWIYMTAADSAGTCFVTSERFSGTVVFNRISTDVSARSVDYALVDYWQNATNGVAKDFTLTDFEIEGLGGATDASFQIWIRKHQLGGWGFDGAGAFGTAYFPTPIVKLSDTQSADNDLAQLRQFTWRQIAIGETFDVSAGEGLVVQVKTTAANALPYASATIRYTE